MDSYIAMLLIAALFNWGDWRGLALCAVVGFGVKVPLSGDLFYALCIAVELIVCMAAMALRTPASFPVCVLSLVLSGLHALGYTLNGYPPESPYHILVKMAEHAEIVACVIFSKTIFGRLKNAAT